MNEITERHIEDWNEANAAYDASGITGPDEAPIAALAKEFARAVSAIGTAIAEAQTARVNLGNVDWEFADGEDGKAKAALFAAHAALAPAEDIADARLRDVTDAEKDEELGRLRVRIAELEARLAEAEVPGDRLPRLPARRRSAPRAARAPRPPRPHPCRDHRPASHLDPVPSSAADAAGKDT